MLESYKDMKLNDLLEKTDLSEKEKEFITHKVKKGTDKGFIRKNKWKDRNPLDAIKWRIETKVMKSYQLVETVEKEGKIYKMEEGKSILTLGD